MTAESEDIEHLFRAIADASPVAIAICEGATHVLRYVNPAFCKLYSRLPHEMRGLAFADACFEGETSAAHALLDRVFQTGAPETLADVSRTSAEGDSVFWTYTVWPLPGQAALAAQVSDTTANHRKAEQREANLQNANQQLLIAALREEERAERLVLADRAKDEFVAMLAHELRNPLAAIRTGLYLLEQRADPEDAETRETCSLLMRQMRHLSRLLDDLLDVSRITHGKIHLQMETVDLVQILRHAVAVGQSQLELKRHTLSLELPSEPVWVEGDPVRLEQIVTNLFLNAIKFMDPGGQVWISLEIVGGDPSRPTAASRAQIRIRDSGIGMKPETLEHIFELFVQGAPNSSSASSGLGIGLALVNRLVQLHGGTVQAFSQGPGCGSEFRVLLPLRPGPASAVASEPALPSDAGLAGKRVLLVEDNVAAAVTMAEVLELWGHEVTVVHTGEGALAAADRRPDVVLLDIGLPGISGFEVARQLRKRSELLETRLVALTGYGQETDRARSREAGFDHHLVKPVDLEELRRILTSGRKPTPPSGEDLAPGAGRILD